MGEEHRRHHHEEEEDDARFAVSVFMVEPLFSSQAVKTAIAAAINHRAAGPPELKTPGFGVKK